MQVVNGRQAPIACRADAERSLNPAPGGLVTGSDNLAPGGAPSAWVKGFRVSLGGVRLRDVGCWELCKVGG